MRIDVHIIPDTGLAVAVAANAPWALTAASAAFEAPATAVSGQLLLEKKSGKVTVSGTIAAEAERACERCGEDVRLALPIDVDLVYLPRPATESTAHPERELQDDELNSGFYEEEGLDIADVICEAVALALPMRITCDDAAACDERTAKLLADKGKSGETGHPAFAQLRNLR